MSLLNLFRVSEIKAPSSRLIKHCAFTLAEVLIVIGIIGIIADMTIPTLVQNYQNRIMIVKLKKVYAMFSQAKLRAEADYGEMSTWEIGDNTTENSIAFTNTYILPYIKVIKNCITSSTTVDNSGACYFEAAFLNKQTEKEAYAEDKAKIYLPDTMSVSISTFSSSVTLVVDIDGKKPPNVHGKDIFLFKYYKEAFGTYGKPGSFYAYLPPSDSIEDIVKLNGSGTCNVKATAIKYAGHYCAVLLMKNGWELPTKEDYEKWSAGSSVGYPW